MYNVIIDAGHGGEDFGATYNGRMEKTDNLNLVRLNAGIVIHQCLYTGSGIRGWKSVAVNGDKVVGPGLIALLGFLRRGFVDVCGAGVVRHRRGNPDHAGNVRVPA